MDTKLLLIAIIAIGILVIGGWIVAMYNSFVTLDLAVDGQWAQVETQYQRRIDLIPNLVNTVEKYIEFEGGILQNITKLRSQWTASATVDDRVRASGQLDSAISRLLLVVENYPNLKADQGFSELRDELAGTENRIAVERMRFNDKVRTFNTAIRVFPNNLFASMFGYGARPFFESQAGAEVAPTVFG